MKEFKQLIWDPNQCRRELDGFRLLLRENEVLKERDDILPFFRNNIHLSAFLGSYENDLNGYDLYAHEYDLFGDVTCDLVAGDSFRKRYVFVEFEDAAPQSIFLTNKAIPAWAPRFERGYSQIIDWFWKLHDMEKTNDYRDRFGEGMRYNGLLIIGRTQHLEPRELRRLEWREQMANFNSRIIRCRTFDQLADDLEQRLTKYLKPQIDSPG